MPKICNCWFIETHPVLGLIKAVDMPQAAVRAMQCDSIRFTSTRLESCAAHLQPPLPTQSVPWTAFGCTLLAFGSHEGGSAGGVVASMVVSQTADPGSIPGRRKADWGRRNGQFLLFLLSLRNHPTELWQSHSPLAAPKPAASLPSVCLTDLSCPVCVHYQFKLLSASWLRLNCKHASNCFPNSNRLYPSPRAVQWVSNVDATMSDGEKYKIKSCHTIVFLICIVH